MSVKVFGHTHPPAYLPTSNSSIQLCTYNMNVSCELKFNKYKHANSPKRAVYLAYLARHRSKHINIKRS